MATQLQIRRGTNSQVAAFTGAEGEIVVNTTNDSIVVSDGSTAGGFEMARADLNNVSDTSLNAALTGNTVSALTITTLTLGSTAITATGAELNILDGVTATTAELNYVDGVTSAIQTQINTKAPLASPTFTGTVTGVNATFTTADNSDNLTLTSTDADASSGPNVKLYRNSSSPADNDFLGNIKFVGRNDNSQDVQYAEQEVYILDASDGTEDGLYNVNIMTAGANTSYMQLSGSAGVVFNEDSSDIDFRVESDNSTHALFVQGSDGNVGIGTSSPSATGWGSANPVLQLSGTQPILSLKDTDTGEFQIANTQQALYFWDSAASSTRMVIDSSGRLSINTTSASELLNVAHTSGNGAGVEFAGNGNTIGSTSAFYGQGSGNDAYVWNRANSTVLIGTNNTERLRIDQDGAITGTMLNATNGEYDGNLNDLKKTGFYRSKNSNSNNPSYAYYSVVVYGNQGNVTAQIATLLAGPATYVRSFNVSWTSWVRIDD
jgi:hypothetical protein